jgi:hypothetical protein
MTTIEEVPGGVHEYFNPDEQKRENEEGVIRQEEVNE